MQSAAWSSSAQDFGQKVDLTVRNERNDIERLLNLTTLFAPMFDFRRSMNKIYGIIVCHCE
jgi:hypothetical protein